jgi:hypothetical protein
MSLQQLIRSHREKWIAAEQWQDPDLTDCLDFMMTEVAEAIEKRLRMRPGYVRNHDRPAPTKVELGIEVFDAIMMGCIALDLLELDLEQLAATKLKRMDRKKGFE